MNMSSAVERQEVRASEGSISERLAHHVGRIGYAALPASTVEASKKLMLDTLAVAWAGRDAPGAPESHAVMRADGGRPEGTVWGYGGKLPASGAAFLNSLFGAALDYDAVNSVHADVCVLPAALAVAEREHASGKNFLTAYAVGADLACRLGATLKGHHRGWFTTSIYGVFGATAAAASLLRLNERAISHAFGIALSQAAGTQQANIEQALTKRLQSAFAARAGVFSALLAAQGITAPREPFEGKFGLFQLYQEGDAQKIFEGLGERFDLEKTNLKKYPTCACGHAALDAALSLIREHDLKPDDVTKIKVIHSARMDRLVGGAFDPSANPQVTAQFSVRYAMASALLRRRVSIEDIQAPAVLDPAIREITDRVEIVIDEANPSPRAPATVVLETRSAGVLTRTTQEFPWSDEAPPRAEDLAAKLDACFSYGGNALSPAARALLVERVRNLEKIEDMSAFFTDIL